MIDVLVHHRVADYDAWQVVYDRILGEPLGSAVRAHRIWRGLDDPNLVVLVETYDSREAAEAAFAQPGLPAVLDEAGVEMESVRLDYLEEVASGS